MSSSVLKTIDKSLFQKELKLIALQIPSQKCEFYREKCKDFLFQMPRLKNIVIDQSDKLKRLLLLNDKIQDKTLQPLPKSLSSWIFSQKDISIVQYNEHIDYDYYTASEVLNALLPTNIEISTAYEQVGDLVHVNLSESLLPYKYLIGQVLLDKVPSCRLVVNKTGKIDTTFRTFPMEVIAGQGSTEVTIHEEGCIYQFDYQKVYWNSRLHHEHTRLVNTFHKDDIIADMFCGVGPFVIPAAKKGCICYANDLNPFCYQFLMNNLIINKVQTKVHSYNMDARAFIQTLCSNHIPITQIIMNLPASAELFCDVFTHCFHDYQQLLPTIHCYMFSNHDDPISDCLQRIEKVMNIHIERNNIEGRIIRDVAPKKRMTLLSFPLTTSMLSL